MGLPHNFGHLVTLQRLLLGCNQLMTLPESLGQLVALRYLNLWQNQVAELPESFDRLTALQYLGLDMHQLAVMSSTSRGLLREMNMVILGAAPFSPPRHPASTSLTNLPVASMEVQAPLPMRPRESPNCPVCDHANCNLGGEASGASSSVEAVRGLEVEEPDAVDVGRSWSQKRRPDVWCWLCSVAKD